MGDSVAVWIVCAVPLFWAVGAYKRLARLRAQAVAAFALLDEQFVHYVELVQSTFTATHHNDGPAARAGLVGAALQLESSAKVARVRPLDALVMRALETAHQTLCASWARVRSEPPDLAGGPLPETLLLQWEHISLNFNHALAEFNRRVQDYNAAVRQFPAVLLAHLCSFRPAHVISDNA